MPALPSATPPGKGTSQRTAATNKRRRHAATEATASASRTTAAKTMTKSTTKTPAATPKGKAKNPAIPKSTSTVGNASPTHTPSSNDDDDEDDQGGQRTRTVDAVEERRIAMEGRVKILEEEGERTREEIRMLRDRLEESEWAKDALGEKTKQMEEEVVSLKSELEKEKESARKKIKEVEERVKRRLSEIEKNESGERQQQQQQPQQQPQQPPQQPQQPQQKQRRRRCIVITDSNGKGATSNSIKNHIQREERDRYDVEVAVAFTVEAAFHRVDRSDIDVREAVVIVDNLTNDIRGTTVWPSLSPRGLAHWVDKLRGRMKMVGVATIVVCQAKPMQVADVTSYNNLLSQYLCTQDQGFGCKTQIRLTYLKLDGYHVRPQFDSIIDKTYACAIRGVPVINPTPLDGFLPDHLRGRWQKQWPRIGGGCRGVMNKGW